MTISKGLIVFLMLTAIGCSSGGLHHTASSIRLAGGGGFSGFYTGYTINSSGEITSWQRRALSRPDTVIATAKINPDSLEFYFRFLDETYFNNFEYESNGNMNYSIDYITPTKTHRVAWGDSDPALPEEIKLFYKLAMAAANRFIEQHN